MKIAVGSDHRGFQAKLQVKAILEQLGAQVIDVGATEGDKSSDYPDMALDVGCRVSNGEAARGILLCGSGIGMSITANKVPGVRAALCHDELTAQMSRRHNDANILCLPADMLGEAIIQQLVKVWMETEFEGGRHARRVQKIRDFEARQQHGHATAE